MIDMNERKFVWMVTFDEFLDMLVSMVACKMHHTPQKYYHIENLTEAFQDAAESLGIAFNVFKDYNLVSETGYNEKHEATLKETPSAVCECENPDC
jgi:hypothetical protein